MKILKKNADMVASGKKRIKTKKAQSYSEEQYRLLFESNPNPMWVYDLVTLFFLAVNDAAVHHYGYSRDEFLGMTIKDIRPPLLDNVSRVTEGPAGAWKHRKKDGSIIFVEITSHPMTFAGRRAELVLANDITRQRRAEENLKQSEEKYRTLINNIQEGVFIAQDSKIQFANEAFARIGGYTVEEVIGKEIRELIAPEDMEMVEERHRRRLAGENVPREYEIRALHKDGKKELIVNMNNIGLLNYRGRVASMGTVTDITESRKAEENLRLFRSLIDQSNDAIFVNDPETGRILDANEKACSNLGYTREDLLKMRVLDIEADIPDRFSWKEHVKEVEEKGYVMLEGRHRRQDGSIFPAEINVKMTMHGKNSYMVAVVRDITERKRGEEELKIKAQLLDKATDSIFVFDLNGNFIYMNDAAYKSRGYEKNELMKMNLHDVVVPEYGKLIDHRIREMLEKRDYVFESAHIHKDGSIIPVEMHASVIESGGRKLILGVTRDITERKRAEKLLHDNARAEFYGFIVSALPVFASNVPSSVRTALVSNFAERFEKNMRPRFDGEMERLGKGQDIAGIRGHRLDVLTHWLLGLFSNIGIKANMESRGTKRVIEFSNCPWAGEAAGNPIYCFICRTIMIRSFTWIDLKGNAEQKASIANGGGTCRFEIHVKP